MNFDHSGDMGDIIYALPTIAALGGGELTLCEKPKSFNGLTFEKMQFLAPLLMLQPYIHKLTLAVPKQLATSPLNRFREAGRMFGEGLTLVDVHLYMYGLPPSTYGPWINKPWTTIKGSGVIISKTARYQNIRFPWRRILDAYEGECEFMGHEEEFRVFVKTYNCKWLKHKKVNNALEAAIAIDNSALFIGNQSLFAAIAEGMGKRMICEIADNSGYAGYTCLFEREGRINARNSNFLLPNIDNEITRPVYYVKESLYG